MNMITEGLSFHNLDRIQQSELYGSSKGLTYRSKQRAEHLYQQLYPSKNKTVVVENVLHAPTHSLSFSNSNIKNLSIFIKSKFPSLLAFVEATSAFTLRIVPLSDGGKSELILNIVHSIHDLTVLLQDTLRQCTPSVLIKCILPRLLRILNFLHSAIQVFQLLIEVWTYQRKGKSVALKTALYIELLKLILKICVWMLSPFRIFVLNHNIIEAESFFNDPSQVTVRQIISQLSKRRRKVVTDESLSFSINQAFLRSLSSYAFTYRPYIAELLYQLRPFLYLYLRKHEIKNRPRWLYWGICTVFDYIALMGLRRYVTDDTEFDQTTLTTDPLTSQNQDICFFAEDLEIQSRYKLLPLSLLRSPFFDTVLSPPLKLANHICKAIPGVDWFNGFESILRFQPCYFFTSGT